MSIDKDINIIKGVYNEIRARNYSTEPELLDVLRKECEFYVFNSLRKRYGSIFEEVWNTNLIPKAGTTDRTILLVERRCHPNVEFCLQNISYYARGYSISIVCSKTNLDYIKACLGTQFENARIIVYFEDSGTPEQGKREYNELLQQTKFWNLFTEEYILTIETDCYLKKRIPDSIYKYDYVASKWPWNPDLPGGGGLSLRRRDVMIKICESFPNKIPEQDYYISDGIKKLGYKYPSFEENKIYFEEFIMTCLFSCGYHQWWTGISSYINNNEILETCLTLQP